MGATGSCFSRQSTQQHFTEVRRRAFHCPKPCLSGVSEDSRGGGGMCSDQRRSAKTYVGHDLLSLVVDENQGKNDGHSSAVPCSGSKRTVRKGKTCTLYTAKNRNGSLYQSVLAFSADYHMEVDSTSIRAHHAMWFCTNEGDGRGVSPASTEGRGVSRANQRGDCTRYFVDLRRFELDKKVASTA